MVRKLFVIFTDMEKAHNRLHRKHLWDILKIYCIEGPFLEGLRSF